MSKKPKLIQIIRKGDALVRINPAFSSLTFWDLEVDLGLAKDRTYKMRKQKWRQISGPKGPIGDPQIDLG